MSLKSSATRRNYLDQFYTIDHETNKYVIEIGLKDYDDVFNTWDSSIYNIRDVDASLKTFLEDCSRDISLKNDVVLKFNLHAEHKDEPMENNIVAGLRNYFKYRIYVCQRNMQVVRRKIFAYTVASIILIVLSLVLGNIAHWMSLKVLDQILTIGGWIFLWETFGYIFTKAGDQNQRKKEYQRLMQSPIVFQYRPSRTSK